jgi:hypothetical protein
VDCVADDGTAWIGYWGDVRWGSLHVRFVSSLVHADGQTITVNRVCADPEPLRDEDGVQWSSPSLGIELALAPRIAGSETELHDGVVWRCVAPSADAVVRLPGRTLRGLGYAEVLEMRVAPWSLPLRQLRWGRAISMGQSLVWIQWKGGKDLQVVVRDGLRVEAVEIGETEVRLADGARLTLSERAPLREDRLANTLAPLRAIAPLLPRVFTNTVERKWRSRGTFLTPDRPNEGGWVIHELLTFVAD